VEVQSLEMSQRDLEEKNPSWQQLERGRLIAEKEVLVAQSDYFPTIGVIGEYTYFHEEPSYGYMPESSWQVMLGAQWTFPLGLQTVEAYKDKANMYAAVQKEVAFAKKALVTQLHVLHQNIESSRKQLAIMERAVKDAKERSQLAIEGYRIEEVETSDMIEAQVEESEVRIQYYEVLYIYQKLLVEYAGSMGRNLHELQF
jgi:outer membrane protein TolC